VPKSSNDPMWNVADDIEDMQSVLASIYVATQTIIYHANHHDIIDSEPSFDQIYIEALGIQESLKRLQGSFSRKWVETVSSIDGQQVIKNGDKVLSFEDAARKAS